MNLQSLREKRERLHSEARSITDAAQKEDRDLTADEQQQIDAKLDEIENVKAQIKRVEALENEGQELQNSSGRKTAPDSLAASAERASGSVEFQKDRREDDPKAGFNHFGEFATAVRSASLRPSQTDERLHIAAAAAGTYANEASGADGGFLVPPEFSSRVRRLALEEDSLYSLTDQNQIAGNSMRFPADETTPWGTNGVRARWESEGTQATQDKPVLKYKELRAHKLISLVPTSDELLEDTNALQSYLERLMGRSIRWKLNDAIINGSGSGQPVGVANANAKVQVTRNNSNQIDAKDVLTMYSRALPASQSRGYWVANSDILPQLGTITVGDQPAYMPPSRVLESAPGGNLLGRPVLLSETAETLGTAGDLRFVDFSQYVTIEKAGGMQNAMSMHLFFDADQMAFRTTFRTDGQPWLDNSVSKNKGNNNLSTIVELK